MALTSGTQLGRYEILSPIELRIMLVLLAGVVVAKAEKKDVRVTGWVSDESCGAEHRKAGGEDCVKKCIKGAPHLNPEWTAQRMVFVTDGEPALWVVENPEALEGYEGKHVRISGQLDSDNLTVRVSKTTPIDKENQVR